MKYRLVVVFEHDGEITRKPMRAKALAGLLGAMRNAFGMDTANGMFHLDEVRLEDVE